jgi:transcriptional regulator with XRE-family HTH domain
MADADAPIRVRFGLRLQALRDARGLSQAEVARRIESDQKEVSAYEHGRVFPRPERLDELADALDVELKDLFDFGAPALAAEGTAIVRLISRASVTDPLFPARALRLLTALLPDRKK